MANALYGLGRQKFLSKTIGWATDNIKLKLVGAGYTPNLTTDEFVDIIAGGDVIATSGNLGSKTETLGVADAADVTVAAVPAGQDITQIVIYKDSGTPSTSPLIGLIDTATGLPFTPNGSDVVVGWDNGANKIFKL